MKSITVDLANKTEIDKILAENLEIVHENYWSLGFLVISINNL